MGCDEIDPVANKVTNSVKLFVGERCVKTLNANIWIIFNKVKALRLSIFLKRRCAIQINFRTRVILFQELRANIPGSNNFVNANIQA